ncbi:MAG: choice-of-anchor Q domain-containing protein, partial [Thermodesulfobacteriota bacterium]
ILELVTIYGNNSTSTVFGEGGGGLFNGASLTGTNVVISSNIAEQGGGYYNNSYYVATLNNFTFNNNYAKYGGGINNDMGIINLNKGSITYNSSNCCGINNSYTGGGGIYNNDGSMSLIDVSIIGNEANSPGGYGGGIYNWKTMSLINVSLINNTAAYGAGIYNGNFDGQANTLTITNSTISGNIGKSSSSPNIQAVGGGIYNTNNGQQTITNSTICQNSAILAAGINNQPLATSVLLRNTILAGNSSMLNGPDCQGIIISGGNNLLGNVSGCSFTPATGDLINLEPRLGSLTGNPPFYPLLFNSPAINAGNNNFCPATDQRGVQRPQKGICDIGSFEYLDPNRIILNNLFLLLL